MYYSSIISYLVVILFRLQTVQEVSAFNSNEESKLYQKVGNSGKYLR